MKNSEKLDQMLRQALAPTVHPSDTLNQKIIDQIKEKDMVKIINKKRILTVVIAATLTLAMSITAVAALHFLEPAEVVKHLGDDKLAKAFEDKNAVKVNETVVSGGYNLTLHGIVSGEGLSGFGGSSENIHPERTYAVVSIANEDGSKMPDTKDDEYGSVPFFISPLIKGLKPWQYNIASMNGAYNELVIDGIMYRLIECDGIEMFADKGLYLCVSSTPFYDTNAYNYDEKTGEITAKDGYNGANALFDLPIDKSKADNKKAEKYLKDLQNQWEESSIPTEENPEEKQGNKQENKQENKPSKKQEKTNEHKELDNNMLVQKSEE